MNQLYQMKGSFDKGTTWYQLEWFDVDFKDFESISSNCNSLEELIEEIEKTFPNAKLKYEFIGKRKIH